MDQRPPMPAGPEDLDLGAIDDISSSDLIETKDELPPAPDPAAAESLLGDDGDDPGAREEIEATDDEAEPSAETDAAAEVETEEPAPAVDAQPIGDPNSTSTDPTITGRYTVPDAIHAIKRRFGELQGVNEYMTDVEVIAFSESVLGEIETMHQGLVHQRDEIASQAHVTIDELNGFLRDAGAAHDDALGRIAALDSEVSATRSDLGAARIALSAAAAENQVLREQLEAAAVAAAALAATRDRLAASLDAEQKRAKSAEARIAAVATWSMWQVEWTKDKKRHRTLVIGPDMMSALRLIEGPGVTITGFKADAQHGVQFKLADAAAV